MGEIPLAQVQPDPLHRVQLGRRGGQRQECNASGNSQGSLVMPARLIEHEHYVHPGCELTRKVFIVSAFTHGRAKAKVSPVPGRQAANRYKLSKRASSWHQS